jgi:hypothetical protein
LLDCWIFTFIGCKCLDWWTFGTCQQEREINNKRNMCTCNEIRRACAAGPAEGENSWWQETQVQRQVEEFKDALLFLALG